MPLMPIPYVAWREQADGTIRPRFQPGPRERRLGFVSADLKHDGGAWYSYEQVRAFMLGPDGNGGKLAEIKAARAGGRVKRPPQAPRSRTVEALLADWLKSPRVKALAPKTQEGYRKQVNAVLYQPRKDRDAPLRLEDFARAPVAAIGSPELRVFFDYQRATRGLHMARASIAVISAAFTWGKDDPFWRLGANPRIGMEFEQPEGRIVIYSDAEIRALVAAADALPCGVKKNGEVITRRSVGHCTLLGLFTGQRQGDRLALEDKGLVDGRRRFEQSKTGAIVDIRETPQLKARLALAAADVAAIKLERGTRPATIIVDETTGEAYNEHTYRHVFEDVRAIAYHGWLEGETVDELWQRIEAEAKDPARKLAVHNRPWRLEPCPSLFDVKTRTFKRDQDLRDTAVTWFARSGAELAEIASITGHSLRSIHEILKHYLAITPELGDNAIAKLVAWMEKEKMVV